MVPVMVASVVDTSATALLALELSKTIVVVAGMLRPLKLQMATLLLLEFDHAAREDLQAFRRIAQGLFGSLASAARSVSRVHSQSAEISAPQSRHRLVSHAPVE